MTDYWAALALAEEAHEGQYDRDGQLHIEHSIRVAKNFKTTDRAAAAAVLHDVLEDTDFELEGKVDDHTLAVVQLLTRDHADTYQEYVAKIASAEGTVGEDARAIKEADLKDNIRRSMEEGNESILMRYLRAKATIRAAAAA